MKEGRYLLYVQALFLSLFFCCSSYLLQAQDNKPVTGQVTDMQSGAPVGAASVFINNSTYAQICNEQGLFELKNFPKPPFELTITAIGYEPFTLRVTMSSASAPLQVKLQQKLIGLEEVTIISPEKEGWRKYGQLFMEEFIGYSPFAQQCKLLNKEVLEFRYDKKDNTLYVSAAEPLRIENSATGYLITYWLKDFEFQFGSRKLFFKGYTRFTALQSSKEKKNKQWTANRLTAYNGSINHFMRSLYKNNTAPEGFVIRRMKRIGSEEYGSYVPVRTDTIAVGSEEGKKRLLGMLITDTTDKQMMMARAMSILQWIKNDSLQEPYRFALAPVAPDTVATREYQLTKHPSDNKKILASLFDKNRLSPGDSTMQSMMNKGVLTMNKGGKMPRSTQRYDIVHPKIIPADSVVIREAGHVQLRFPDYLYIMYTGEEEERAYQEVYFRGKPFIPAKQASVISMSNPSGVAVMENGNFENSYDLLAEAYWSYEKLDKLLPLDYQPPASLSSE